MNSAVMLSLSRISLDAMLYYTDEQAQLFFASLTSKQWQAYQIHELIDLFLFLPIYTWLAFLFMRRLFPYNTYLLSLAFIPGVFDLIETTTILLYLMKLIQHFPNSMGYITFYKWLDGALLLAALVFGCLLRWLRKKHS